MDKNTSGKDGRSDQENGNNTQLLTEPTTVPSEHPGGPDFDPDFGKMNQEFRDKIRRGQHEEWDCGVADEMNSVVIHNNDNNINNIKK